MKQTLIITILLAGASLLFSCDKAEQPPATSGQALPAAETFSASDGELPVGITEPTAIGFHNLPPYTIFTPNDNWIDHTQGGTPFFIRVEAAGSNSELAYLEVYPLYDLPDVVENALWLGQEPNAALEEYLRELVGEMVSDAKLSESQQLQIDGYPAARLRYKSDQDAVSGERTATFSEVTIVLVGRRLHLVEAYCYAEFAGQLRGELTLIADHLRIEPPPPPPVVLTEEELAALELAEGEAGEATEPTAEASEIE